MDLKPEGKTRVERLKTVRTYAEMFPWRMPGTSRAKRPECKDRIREDDLQSQGHENKMNHCVCGNKDDYQI